MKQQEQDGATPGQHSPELFLEGWQQDQLQLAELILGPVVLLQFDRLGNR